MSRLVDIAFNFAKSSCSRLNASNGPKSELIVVRLLAAIIIIGGGLAACTDISITRAQHQIAAGDFAAAHQYFANEAARSTELSQAERRKVLDGLCLTEYRIGATTYPISRQLRTCGIALEQPGSESGAIFSDVARHERESLTKTIDGALAQRDVATADDAILRYRALPESDPQLVEGWTRQVWAIVNRESTSGRVALRPAITRLSHQFHHEQTMTDRQFRQWIEQNMTVGGTQIISDIEVRPRTIALWLGDDQVANAALYLDRLARINDGLIARCHCNGSTKVVLKGSGLPAYLVRLEPGSHQSEVLIVDQP